MSLCSLSRSRVGVGAEVALHEQDRVPRARGPGGGRHRVCGLVGGREHDVRRLDAGELGAQLLDRGGHLGRIGALDVGHAKVVGRRDVADREGLRVVGLRGALGAQRHDRGRGQLRHLIRTGDEDGRADRRRHEHRGRDAGGPVLRADQAYRRGALEPALRREGRSAAPAATAAESPPPIRVVFLVAKPGKPSCSAATARSCSPAAATRGAGRAWTRRPRAPCSRHIRPR